MDRDIWEAHYNPDYKPWLKPEDFLMKEVSGMKPGRAVDLGSGECFNSIWMAEQGWDVTAVDFAPSALRIGQKIAAERDVVIKVAEADIRTYQPGVQFDLVYIGYIHVPESVRKVIIKNAVSLLAPGGTIIYVGFLRGEVQQDEMIPLEDMATREDIERHLGGLEIKISDTDHVTMEFEEGPIESDIVIVKAIKP